MATKTKKKPAKPDWSLLVTELVASMNNLATEIRKGTAEMKRYRSWAQTPPAIRDNPDMSGASYNGIPDTALLETDRARSFREEEQ